MAIQLNYPTLPLNVDTIIDGDDIKVANARVAKYKYKSIVGALFSKAKINTIKERQVYSCKFEATKITVSANGNLLIDGPYEDIDDYTEDDRFFYFFTKDNNYFCVEKTLCPPDFVDYIRTIFN